MSIKRIEKGKTDAKREVRTETGQRKDRDTGKEWVFGQGASIEVDQKIYELYTPQGARLFIKHYGENADQASLRTGSRNNRICHFSGDSCGHCDYSDYCLQAQIRRIVGGDHFGNQQLVEDERGQSTAEFAIVFGLMACIILGLSALMSVLNDGIFVQHAVTSASHNAEVLLSGVVDAFAF